MSIRKAVVLALPDPADGSMVSRLPSYLHPVSGRPLIWHTVAGLLALEPGPPRILVLTTEDFPEEVLDDLAPNVSIGPFDPAALEALELGNGAGSVLVAHGSASIDSAALRRLAEGEVGSWVGGSSSQAAAALASPDQLLGMLQVAEPLTVPNGFLSPIRRLEAGESFVVRSRPDLARLQHRVRNQLIRNLMDGGATFLLPESVLVDVDVRIGRDTVVYPGVVIEGQTTIGEETVIGPSCRILDSWIGSGVELKGWNYVSHTSVRNRAILEPYVRRGFD